jgi:hypothetical protein
MDSPVLAAPRIPAMAPGAIDKVRQLEALAKERPQVAFETEHVLHGGMYARTICVPAGVMITGALVKLATLLIIQGDALAYVGGDEPLRLQGYGVLAASAGRKQVFVALADTRITMVFPTEARTVDEAERQFTDEAGILSSRGDPASNRITITGE